MTCLKCNRKTKCKTNEPNTDVPVTFALKGLSDKEIIVGIKNHKIGKAQQVDYICITDNKDKYICCFF